MAWNVNNKGGVGGARKRKLAKDKPKSIVKHLKRATAQLKLPGAGTAVGQVVLNDMTPKGLEVFVADQIAPELEVALTMEYPTRFFVRGRVAACNEVSSTNKVLSDKKLRYRATVIFILDSAEQEQAVAAHVAGIQSSLLNQKKAA
jgi:hypothetical protein